MTTRELFAANLSTMFQDEPFAARAVSAAQVGFGAVEVQFPYEHSISDWQRSLLTSGMRLVLLNTPKGANGEPGLAALPERREEFRAGLTRAVEYAQALECPLVHVMAGVDGDRSCYVENLTLAVTELARVGARPVIEVLNQFDVPGYHLRSTADAVAVSDEVPGVGVQFDLYHCLRAGEEVAVALSMLRVPPAHVQVSSCPGRHEPDAAALAGLRQVVAEGYGGYVGCEYWPVGTTRHGLGWLNLV